MSSGARLYDADWETFRCANLDWMNDEAGEQVGGVDNGQRLQQAGSGRAALVPVTA